MGMYALLWGKKKESEKIPLEVITILRDIEIKILEGEVSHVAHLNSLR